MACHVGGRMKLDQLDSSGTELDVLIVEGRNRAMRDSSRMNSAILPIYITGEHIT